MYKYTNISGVDQDIIGVGIAKAGETFESPVVIENPNFEYVSKSDGSVVGTVKPQPTVDEATLSETKTEETN